MDNLPINRQQRDYENLCRNFQMLFPVKMDDVEPNKICQKLGNLHEQSLARQTQSVAKLARTLKQSLEQ